MMEVDVAYDGRLQAVLWQHGAADVLGTVLCWEVRTHGAIWPDLCADGLAVATALAPQSVYWQGAAAALAVLRDGSWESYRDAIRALARVTPGYRISNTPDGFAVVPASTPGYGEDPPAPASRHAPVRLPHHRRAILASPAAAAVIGAAAMVHLLDHAVLAWRPHPQARWAVETIAMAYPSMAMDARYALALLEAPTGPDSLAAREHAARADALRRS